MSGWKGSILAFALVGLGWTAGYSQPAEPEFGSSRRVMPSVMVLSLIMKHLIVAVVILSIVSVVEAKSVCDLHLSRIKMIPFTGEPSEDAHYDALKNAGKSAVPCLIANVTNTRSAPDPRPIPRWGTMRMTIGDRAVYMLEIITGVNTIKMLPRRYQDLYNQIGVYARDEYLHDRRINRFILQRKLWRWYRTMYLPFAQERRNI